MVKGRLLVAVLFASFAAACSVSAPAGQDLFATSSGTTPSPSPAPAPAPTQPCLEAIGCPPGETFYATITDCTSAGEDRCRLERADCRPSLSSYYCGSSDATCEAYPSCDDDDLQVISCGSAGDCYTRTICGTTITCQRPYANCSAMPTCDAGDPQVFDLDDCKLASSDCYSRTMCGATIWCNNLN